jgi:hypothetical protein
MVDAGRVAHSRETIASRHYVVGAPLPGRRAQYYFFFYSEQQTWDDLQTLRHILPSVRVALVLLGAAGGIVPARRTLAPVYATLGPFTTRELAERRARESGAVHYRVRASGPRCWEQPVREAQAV